MGYYTNTVESLISIPKAGFPAICKHLRDIRFDDPSVNAKMMSGGSYEPGHEGKTAAWYSWVDTKELTQKMQEDDLLGVFVLFGFELSEDQSGNIIGLSYNTKSGDEEALLKAIAPFMEDGNYLWFQGEDATHYRFHWRNQELHYSEGRIQFPPM
jgi:hypothetical protein